MHPPALRRILLPLGVAAAMLATSVATPAQARTEDRGAAPAVAAPAADRAAVVTDRLARQLSRLLADPAVAERVRTAVAAGPVDLLTVEPGSAFARAAAAANRSLLAAKGLSATDQSLLRLRLAHPDMLAALERGDAPLVAAVPSDDAVTDVVAYDRSGTAIRLDGTRMPQQPVLAVEVDVVRAMTLGLQLVRDTLAAHGLHAAAAEPKTATVSATSGYWANKVDAVRLSDDKEPWIKGAAEIFCIVGGFGLDGKVKIDIVQMPYLDHDGKTYYPNQLVVHYSAYKYNLADVVMMEDDGDTNYQSLATALVNALLYIVDGGAYTPLVNAILNAIPTSWWTDDPDYVDSWYTLATTTSGRRYGAAGNGWMDISPYWVQAF
ncbi:MAG TPA: DUF3103 family protein [Micromonosporaceae bacterium]